MQKTIKPSWRMTTAVLAAALIGAGAPTAYAALGEEAPAPNGRGAPFVETSLLFGTVRPDGGPPVTDEQFHWFIDEVVTPRFPDGLTVQDGYGQYRDANGVIERERSFELILLYPVGEYRDSDPKIEQIRAEYVARFAQESVARVDDRAAVDF
ncbi:Protein of unknown function [Saccharopolyspora antimicrobica]|uniref:Uncharacterized protein DUF3574 n=1 Tax=Saccharopolyspora antimicrobica TaxID=455193 RepID=A0A1I5GM09_9PSEU|nr:DUF3574 domain-containing protein [Saccharopolyspora antimicrobica]RKT87465.1 uncharacterized protein DUF3574 [Saccharopolyspora antimicrobica]SFO37084.1 Protein of unknown function [Saccharopolyspora antimicrobica]